MTPNPFQPRNSFADGSSHDPRAMMDTLGKAIGTNAGDIAAFAGQPINMPSSYVQDTPTFAGGGMPMPVGLLGHDPALANPSLLSRPGVKLRNPFASFDTSGSGLGIPNGPSQPSHQSNPNNQPITGQAQNRPELNLFMSDPSAWVQKQMASNPNYHLPEGWHMEGSKPVPDGSDKLGKFANIMKIAIPLMIGVTTGIPLSAIVKDRSAGTTQRTPSANVPPPDYSGGPSGPSGTNGSMDQARAAFQLLGVNG